MKGNMKGNKVAWARIGCLLFLGVAALLTDSCGAGSIPAHADGNAVEAAALPGSRLRPPGLAVKPLNVAGVAGEAVVLVCQAVDPPPISRIMWVEFILSAGGNLISENGQILTGHPNHPRYSIISESNTQFNLKISDLRLEDAGQYACQDALDGNMETYRGYAQLIVLESRPQCPSTMNGIVRVGEEHSILCSVVYRGDFQYAPKMTWFLPTGQMDHEGGKTETQVWSKVTFIVNESMNGADFTCVTYFASLGEEDERPPLEADNAPIFEDQCRVGPIIVE